MELNKYIWYIRKLKKWKNNKYEKNVRVFKTLRMIKSGDSENT